MSKSVKMKKYFIDKVKPCDSIHYFLKGNKYSVLLNFGNDIYYSITVILSVNYHQIMDDKNP